ncbi:MAG: PilZ domain-containing protein [Candidatus Methylomirabilales bacterium]
MHRRNGERRCHLRWDAGRQAAGRITVLKTGICHGVSLVDISMGGALLEHPNVVRPGAMAFLSLPVHDQRIGMKCRAVRSLVDRYHICASGERDLVYRTGVEFLDTSGSAWRLIKAYVVDEFSDSLSSVRWCLPPEVGDMTTNGGGAGSDLDVAHQRLDRGSSCGPLTTA